MKKYTSDNRFIQYQQKVLENENGEDNDYEYFAIPSYRFNERRRRMDRASVTKLGIKTEIYKGLIKLDDNYRWHTSVWIVLQYSHVYKTVERFVLLCHQHGFIEHWLDLFHYETFLMNDTEPKVLTMKMLSAGFYIWLVSVAIACVVFIGEHIYFFSMKKINHNVCLKHSKKAKKKQVTILKVAKKNNNISDVEIIDL